jgi:hypothetical protein
MDKTTSVYWLYDETCVDPRTDGYIGFTAQRPPKRFSQHQYATGIYRRVPKKFRSLILFQGSVEECEFLEEALRPHKFIGWNVLAGGSHSLKRHGVHNFRFGTHMSEKEKNKIRAKIIERGGIVNPVPKGTQRTEAERATISAGTKAAGPMTAEQRARQIANTPHGEQHHAFGKPMRITNPRLGKDQNGERNGFFGRHHSEKTKAHLRAIRSCSVCVRGHPKEPGKRCHACDRINAKLRYDRKRQIMRDSI